MVKLINLTSLSPIVLVNRKILSNESLLHYVVFN